MDRWPLGTGTSALEPQHTTDRKWAELNQFQSKPCFVFMRLSGSLNSKDFPAKWLLLQLAACWLNWLFRVPLRAGRRLCLVKCPTRLRFNILSKSAGLKLIFNRVKKRWFLDVVIIQTMSFRWSEPLLFLDMCRKLYPLSICLQLTCLKRNRDSPSWLQSELQQCGDKDQTISRGNCVANCTSVETCGAERTSFGALMHQMQFWNS